MARHKKKKRSAPSVMSILRKQEFSDVLRDSSKRLKPLRLKGVK